jgi:hypothetical protein
VLSPNAKNDDFLNTCKEILLEFNDRVRRIDGNEQLNSVALYMKKKMEKHEKETWVWKDFERRFEIMLGIRVSKREITKLEFDLHARVESVNVIRKQQSNLKPDGVQICDKLSGTIQDTRQGDGNSRYPWPEFSDQRWMTDKAKTSVLIDNRNYYEHMIMTHIKVIEPMQKRIIELKEDIIQNELKVRTVL